jgi:hypothetical protein
LLEFELQSFIWNLRGFHWMQSPLKITVLKSFYFNNI